MTSPSASNAPPGLRPPERFRLTGPSVELDLRVNAVRRDIADVALADRIFAPHYARASHCRCIAPSASMYEHPDANAKAVSQLLFGEEFAVIDVAGGWAWGYSARDRYVGYLHRNALGDGREATHVVTVPLALVFAAPDIKSQVVARWTMGARFQGSDGDGFAECAEGFLHLRHIRKLDEQADDPVAVAERLIGQPYLWGGRGGGGIDCSGLVQLAMGMCGIDAPRDSDQQSAVLGREIDAEAALRRGDLIFMPGHVGMMVDGDRLIHANAFWMAVTVEPLAAVVTRAGERHADPILARRRLAS